ncbi:hypothetical protein LTR66_003508, partial [Elasticomyces elasticus]
MLLSSLFTALPLFAAFIHAGPVTPTAIEPPHVLEKRNLDGVRLCTGRDWSGSCWYGVYPINTCIFLGG